MSSALSFHYRLETPPIRAPRWLIPALALLALIATLCSGLPWCFGLPIWGAALAIMVRRARSPSVDALVLAAPDQLLIVRAGGEHRFKLIGFRRLGPLLVLHLDEGDRDRLLMWLPALSPNARRECLRAVIRCSARDGP